MKKKIHVRIALILSLILVMQSVNTVNGAELIEDGSSSNVLSDIDIDDDISEDSLVENPEILFDSEMLSESDDITDYDYDLSDCEDGLLGQKNEITPETTDSNIDLDETDIASGSYGNTTWKIDKNGKLFVKGTGNAYSPGGFRDVAPWYNYRDSIISAEVELTGATDLGYFFYECANLAEVDLSKLNTSDVKTMISMFQGCKQLKEIDVTRFNTAKVIDMSSMFQGCISLESVDVSGFNTSSTTSMSGMFAKCNTLENIDVSNFVTSNVIYMSSMFMDCYNLSEIDLGNFDTSKVKLMNSMFRGCCKLREIDLS